MKKLYITLSIMLITLFAQIAKAQVSTDSGTSEFLKASNSQLIRLLEPIYLLRVREASD